MEHITLARLQVSDNPSSAEMTTPSEGKFGPNIVDSPYYRAYHSGNNTTAKPRKFFVAARKKQEQKKEEEAPMDFTAEGLPTDPPVI
jgi:hypothetical protein